MRFRKVRMKEKARDYYHQYMSPSDLTNFIERAERTFLNALLSDSATPFFDFSFQFLCVHGLPLLLV